jgi:membrane-associated phospholipid phosphatase
VATFQDLPRPPRLASRIVVAWLAHLAAVLILAGLLYRAAGPILDLMDEAGLRAMFGLYTVTGAEIAETIALLGQPWLSVPVLVAACGIVFVYVGPREALFVFVVYFFSGADYLILVEVFARARPHLFEELPPPTGFSTPSGHAIATMGLWLSLAWIAWQRDHRGLAAVCALVWIASGLTRPYLQVHYPSDVLLAWILTGTWMIVVHALLAKESRRGV